MFTKDPKKPQLPRAVGIVVSLSLAVLIGEFLPYLIKPSESLYEEAGWLSYRGDRSARIEFLLWYGADPNKIIERDYAAIHTAVHWKAYSAIKQLIDAGADVNLQVGDGRARPLDIACMFAGKQTIELLIENDAIRTYSHPEAHDRAPTPPMCFDQEAPPQVE